MYLCKYDITQECKAEHEDCKDCILDKIKAEIDGLDFIAFDGIIKKRCLEIIDKYKAEYQPK